VVIPVLPTPKENAPDPYVGPRPFERNPDDKKRFFGRDKETDEILSLIFSHPIVLIYAQSGAGKTSIFNACVIPALEEHGLQVLKVARVVTTYATDGSLTSAIKDSQSSHDVNQYVFNLLQSIIQRATSQELTSKSVSEFLDEYFPSERDERGNVKPQVIIVDQLEELFNLYPNNKWREQQEAFFQQIANASNNNPALRVVFIIREDYVARLEPFEEILRS